METKLTVVRGKASKEEITLQLPAVIGRSRQAELAVVHPMVSRRHCELLEADGRLVLRDLGSLNGTTVDGEHVKEVRLDPDSEFSVGPLSFRVQYEVQDCSDADPRPAESAGKESSSDVELFEPFDVPAEEGWAFAEEAHGAEVEDTQPDDEARGAGPTPAPSVSRSAEDSCLNRL
jgi:pSer/pThr/pTyr-binding forkhead associated (FHA) protein